MTVTMYAVTVAVAPETAIEGTAIKPSARVQRRFASGRTAFARHETHRYGAHGRGAHHRQDHTARSFCLIVVGHGRPPKPFRHARVDRASRSHAKISAAAGKMRRDGLGEAAETAARHARGFGRNTGAA